MKRHASPPVRADRMSIGVGMLLVAGAAVGFWLAIDFLKTHGRPDGPIDAALFGNWVFGFVFLLGGLSLVGPPLLLMTARRRHWGAGRFLWFVQGTAAWLLWPPGAYHGATGESGGAFGSSFFFFYCTPPMALYVTLTLVASGHMTHSRRRRMHRSWQETFGLLLGLAWACTGLYIISLFYREDIFRG